MPIRLNGIIGSPRMEIRVCPGCCIRRQEKFGGFAVAPVLFPHHIAFLPVAEVLPLKENTIFRLLCGKVARRGQDPLGRRHRPVRL